MNRDETSTRLPERIAAALDALPQDEAIASRLAEARRDAVRAAEFRARLEDESMQVGPEAQARLQAARRAALERVSAAPKRRAAVGLAWAGTAAAAALLAVLVLPTWLSGADGAPLYQSEDEELAVQEMELLQDIEFIAWLEAEQSRTSPDPGSSDRAG